MRVDFKCPYCGRDYNVVDDELCEDLVTYWGDGDLEDIECSNCEKVFTVREWVHREFEATVNQLLADK